MGRAEGGGRRAEGGGKADCGHPRGRQPSSRWSCSGQLLAPFPSSEVLPAPSTQRRGREPLRARLRAGRGQGRESTNLVNRGPWERYRAASVALRDGGCTTASERGGRAGREARRARRNDRQAGTADTAGGRRWWAGRGRGGGGGEGGGDGTGWLQTNSAGAGVVGGP